MPPSNQPTRGAAATIAGWLRPSPELILLIATAISGFNALVAVGVLHLGAVHLAVVNVGFAFALGVVARGLVPAEPPAPADGPADRRAHQPERGSTS